KALAGAPFWVRANVHGGGVREFEGDGDVWWEHPDKAMVDAVVCPWVPPRDIDVIGIDESTMLTDSRMRELGIGIGDDVHIVGLFAKHYGQKQNIPIVRTGKLPMLPGE